MYKLLLFLAGTSLFLGACSDSDSEDGIKVEIPQEIAQETEHPPIDDSDSTKILQLADSIIQLLDKQDFTGLGAIIGNGKIRFSPYAHVNMEGDNQLNRVDLASSPDVKQVWGNYDGTGAPIILSFRNYFERFVYNHPYASDTNVIVSYNSCKGGGNSLNNIESAYKDHCFVEYLYPGKHERDYMDWTCIRMVFKKADEQFVLVGIVHDEWTV